MGERVRVRGNLISFLLPLISAGQRVISCPYFIICVLCVLARDIIIHARAPRRQVKDLPDI
jgi:hypothetical protein